MRRVRSLVAIATIALLTGSPRAAMAVGMIPFPAQIAATSTVTALSIVPSEGRADIVITLSGAARVEDFTVPSPHRIVLDISGAKLQPFSRAYDRVSRAGITNVRLAQYRTDVVRVVFDMDQERSYTVTQDGNTIRMTLQGPASFAAWSSTGRVPSAQVAAAARQATTVESTGVVEQPRQQAQPAPARPAPAAPPAARSVEEAVQSRPEPTLQLPAQRPRITVTYANAEIRDVLAAFATFSNRTIVAGKDVTGNVTAEIKDQPWDVALRAILEAHGLAAIEEVSGIITVDSYKNILEKQASEPVSTQMVNINYVAAGSLVQTVQGLLYKDCAPGSNPGAPGAGPGAAPAGCIIRGNIAADSGTNSLIVTEVTSRLPSLLNYIKGLDIRTPQVALKGKIIAVSRTNIEQLGLSYDIGSKGTFLNTLLPRIPEGQTTPGNIESQVELGGDAIAGVANATRKYKSAGALNLIFSTALGKYSLTSFLDALQESQLSDVQAEPSIVTLDNKEARMIVGQETPVRVIDAGSVGQVGAQARANVQFRETGIILRVTPHITSNRQIRMEMEAEQSELRIIGGDLGFIIDKRQAKTNVLVADGETAVIGGLVQTTVTKTRSGIPFLSDLPLIGRFFSQSESREEKRDLLIMITPTILDEGDPIRPPGSESR